MDNEEFEERVQYFYDIAARYGHQVVPVPVAQRLFEEVVQPARFGFSGIAKNLYGKSVSADVVHLLKFQAVKGSTFSLWWGVSLAYMPHKWQPRLEWHRTLKSSRLDLFEEPFEYFRLQTIPWRQGERYYAHGMYGEAFLREGLVNMWNVIQPSVLAWLTSAQSYEDIAEKAARQAARKWIGPRHWPDPLLIYAFTLARSGKVEDAQKALESFLRQSTETPEAQDHLKRALLQVAAA